MKMELLKVIVLILIFASVKCLAEETTLPPEEETTTEEPTTAEPPSNTPLQELDFRMTSIVGNFFVDINFTEIRGDSNAVDMIVKVNALPNSEPSRYLCKKLLGIYLLNLPNCEGLDISIKQPARLLSPLNKGAGEESVKVSGLSIQSLLSLNCLVVAADNATFNEIFTSTSSSTSTSTIEPTTTVPEETTIPTINQVDVVPSSLREMARKLRQLGIKSSNSNIKVGNIPYMKHQYDVKKIAQQVDSGESHHEPDFEDKDSSYSDDLGPDYYDPEDLTDDENLKLEELENDIDIQNLLGAGNPGVDDFDIDERFGLDRRTVDTFRSSGCPAGKVSDRIPLLESQSRAQTRTFTLTGFAIVLSSGSVSSGSTSIVNSNTPGVVYFGNVGSFTFNPFANWPVVTLQGFYVLSTYGVIILWALAMGAIVWGVSIGGLFSARRVGYVASELIYRPVERLTTMVHSGIERFSHLNRRNSRKKSARRPSPYYHRFNEFDYEENYFNDYEEQWQNHRA